MTRNSGCFACREKFIKDGGEAVAGSADAARGMRDVADLVDDFRHAKGAGHEVGRREAHDAAVALGTLFAVIRRCPSLDVN